MSSEQTAPHPRSSEPALRTIAMPGDANPNGDIFGGWLLAQMRLAGGSVGSQRAQGRVATLAGTGMTFHRPVYIRGEVRRHAAVTPGGSTSSTMHLANPVRRH